MIGLIALGTIGFWIALVLLFCFITALVESESGAWATVVLAITVLVLEFGYKLPLFALAKANPGHTAILIGSYFLAGIVWSIIKWYFFLHKKVVKYNNLKSEFMTKYKVKELTPELANAFLGTLPRYLSLTDAPKVSDHKSDLTRWMTYWPFSLMGTMLNDVVRKTWEYIYERLQTTYQKMSDAMFKDITRDEEMAELHRNEAKSRRG